MTLESNVQFVSFRPATSYPAKIAAGLVALVLMLFTPLQSGVHASANYTDKQMDALATRVGRTFWIYAQGNNKLPAFVTAPNAAAATFPPANKESFIIIDLAGRASRDPYYTVKFESGKIAYIQPDLFHEALNLTILSVDPFAEEKQKAQQQAAEEKDRIDWIKAQPWPMAVKEAAIKRQPTPGLTNSEVKRIYGAPQRTTKLRGPTKDSEEHWFYPDGSVLVFINGLFSRIEKLPTK
jgi:hypothetical protein